MKYLILSLLFLLMIACDTADTDNADASTTTATPVATAPVPTSTTTVSEYIAEDRSKPFLDLVEPKQTAFEAETNGEGHRRDTLYQIADLPYKDQEMYLYQTVLNQPNKGSANWSFSILKNGSTVVNEQIISKGKFIHIAFHKMEIGDPSIEFVGTKKNGEQETISFSYDGKAVQ